MNNFAHTAIKWATRIFLLLAAAVFVLSLVVVAGMLAMVWGARALWAKLTGRPVAPWAMPMRPAANWAFYRSGSWASTMGAAGGSANAADGEAGAGSKRSGVLASVAGDITDVQAREVK